MIEVSTTLRVREKPTRTDLPAAWRIGELGLVAALLAILVAHYLHVARVTTESSTVWASAFSREADRVAIASEVGNAVFDIERREVEFSIHGRVSALAYSHDGTVLAVGGFDGDVRLLEASTGDEIRSLEGLTARIGRIRFSADDRKLVAIGFDEHFAVWETSTGNRVCRIEAGQSHRYAVDFVYGDTHVVTGGGSGNNFVGGEAKDYTGHDYGDKKTHSFKVWNLETGLVTKTWNGPEHCYVEDIAVSKDGRRLVTGLSIPTVRVWDIESQKELAVFEAQAHDGLSVKEDEKLLLGLRYGGVDVCDLSTGTSRKLKVAGAAEAATIADDGTILTLDQTGYLTRWDAASGAQIAQTDGYTLRTLPLNLPILAVSLTWLLVWILWHLAKGLGSLLSPAALLLPALAGLFIYTGYAGAQADFHFWAASDPIGHHGGMLFLFFWATVASAAAFGWSCHMPKLRRPVPMLGCLVIALGGMVFHGLSGLAALASAG